LVRSEADYLKALKHCRMQPVYKWVRNDHSDATAHYLTRQNGGECVIVAIRVTGNRSAIEIAGLLVHEAVHVVQRYFESIGENEPATEQYAYAVQSVAQELMAEYARQIEEEK